MAVSVRLLLGLIIVFRENDAFGLVCAFDAVVWGRVLVKGQSKRKFVPPSGSLSLELPHQARYADWLLP